MYGTQDRVDNYLRVYHSDPQQSALLEFARTAFIRGYNVKRNTENIERHKDIYMRKGKHKKKHRMYKRAGKANHLVFKLAADIQVQHIEFH